MKKLDKTIIKANLLKAMKEVHKEYVKKTHTLSMTDCAMCKLYRDQSEPSCTICPMSSAFRNCGNRNCHPIDCSKNSEMDKRSTNYKKHLKAVTKFYELAIVEVENLSEEELQTTTFNFLRDIDKAVEILGYREFGVIGEPKETNY